MAQPDNKFTEEELMSLFSNMMGAGPAAAPAAPAPAPAPAAVAPVAPPPPPPAPVSAAPPPPPPVAPAPMAPPPPVPAAVPGVPAPAGISAAPPPPPPPVAPVAPVAAPIATASVPPPPSPLLGRPPAPVSAPPPPAPAAPAAAAPAAPAPAAPTTPVIDEATKHAVEDLGHQFEIGRNRVEQVLTPFIGEKVTKKMLAWSLERVQKTHPIMKMVHWAPNGDLLDNGEVEVGRLVQNLDGFIGMDAVMIVKAALNELLNMRLSAVEQTLGPSMRQAVEKEVSKLQELVR